MSNRTKAKLLKLEARRKEYDNMSTDQQRKHKRPGSRKK